MNSLLLSTVPDPTDFPPDTTAPGLRTLDAALRCTICGELYDAPVTLTCGHCFCSFCARATIAVKQECPTCRKTATEGHLRPNPIVEEIIVAWKLSRPYVLKLSKEDEQQTNQMCLDTPKSKKRKFTLDSARPRSASILASPLKRKNVKRASPESDAEVTIPTSDIDEDEMQMLDVALRQDGMIDCPICSRRVKYKNINQHIDRGCQDPPESSKSHWNKIMNITKKEKNKEDDNAEDDFPLPKAAYATLKDKQLKDMLLEHKLPTTGDRNLWIQRHQRWVMAYNANLDRSQALRKTADELRKGLKRWEEEKSRKRKTAVEDGAAHQKYYKDEFSQLIKAARTTKKSSSSAKDPVVVGTASQVVESPSSCERKDVIVDSEGERSRSRYF